jgi:hypothetical protein
VNVQCNNQTTSPHSCAVVAEATSSGPVFSSASTTNPVTGLQPGASQSFTFTASQPGQYRMALPGTRSRGCRNVGQIRRYELRQPVIDDVTWRQQTGRGPIRG